MRERCNVTLVGTILGEPQRGRTKGSPIKKHCVDRTNLQNPTRRYSPRIARCFQ